MAGDADEANLPLLLEFAKGGIRGLGIVGHRQRRRIMELEDVDVIGISSLATDHLIVPKLMVALREAGLDDVAVIVGGIVPDADEAMLIEAGVARVFHPGSSMADIAAHVHELALAGRARRAAV